MTSDQAMALAIQVGKRGLGSVHPNPAVGCVILDSSGSLIGQGAHLKYGESHAEINALASVKNHQSLKGASLYVTLEPCAHQGKTPSCAEALSKTTIRRVVYGVIDPNPLVQGQGVNTLLQAGKEVGLIENPKLQKQCRELAEIFLYTHKFETPFVALKAGTSLNGSLVPVSGQGWVTGPESRKFVHELRAQYDAVLVGVDTFLQDNPKLNIRISDGLAKENRAVVLDPQGRGVKALKGSNLLSVRREDKIFWVTQAGVEVGVPGVHHISLSLTDKGGFDLAEVLSALWKKDIKSVFVEGGARTFYDFLSQRQVQRVYHFQSPVQVPWAEERPWAPWMREGGNFVAWPEPSDKLQFGEDEFLSYCLWDL